MLKRTSLVLSLLLVGLAIGIVLGGALVSARTSGVVARHSPRAARLGKTTEPKHERYHKCGGRRDSHCNC